MRHMCMLIEKPAIMAHSTATQRAEAPLRARPRVPALATGPAVLVVVLLDASSELHEGWHDGTAHQGRAVSACYWQ